MTLDKVHESAQQDDRLALHIVIGQCIGCFDPNPLLSRLEVRVTDQTARYFAVEWVAHARPCVGHRVPSECRFLKSICG